MKNFVKIKLTQQEAEALNSALAVSNQFRAQRGLPAMGPEAFARNSLITGINEVAGWYARAKEEAAKKQAEPEVGVQDDSAAE